MQQTRDIIPELTFDDMWKPTEVFNALYFSCKYFIGKWENNIEWDVIHNKPLEPDLVFCNHPDNKSDVEGNCNVVRCPLLEHWARNSL